MEEWQMPTRSTVIAGLIAAAFALAALPAVAQPGEVEPYAACYDGECDIVEGLTPEELELAAGDDESLVFPADGDPPGDVVCLEGVRGCVIRGADVSIADIELVHDGRVIHGVVDADPAGGWRAVNRRARMTCKPRGSKAVRITLKRSSDRGTISREGDALIAQSRRSGEPSFQLLRLGPGVYASIQPFDEAGVTGEMVNYYGMRSADKIAGTSIVRTTTTVAGRKTTCRLDRNFDMTRTSGPPPGDPSAAGTDGSPDDLAAGSPDEGAAMAFDEDEVEPIGGDGPAMVFDEDEVTDEDDE
jgi:hypothetical protein